MKFPRLSGSRPSGDTTIQFKGYNNTDNAGRGEFTAMTNMSGDRYPLLSPRKPRGTVRYLGKPNGLIAREKLMWADGKRLYYDGKKIAEVGNTEKTFISFGAYVLIFPDKLMYNTATGEMKEMENIYTSAATVSWKQTWLTESDLDSEGQVYIEISSSGIHKGFQKGDAVEMTGFVEEVLNGHHVLQDVGEGWIKIVAAVDADGSQGGRVVVKKVLPECDFWTVSENRLWGCSSKNHEVYGSKLGDPTNFYNYEGTADSAYAATIANDGEFTGAITYLGYVMFFKENSVHKIYGNKPSNFQIVEGQLRGVAKGCHRSMQIVNEVLFYKSTGGVMSFQGSMPADVGSPIEKGYGKAEAGSVGDKYYISMEKDGEWHLFVYDAANGIWHREDNTQARWFTKNGDKLYFISESNIMTAEGDDNGVVEWSAETSDFTYQRADAKFVSRVSIRCEVDEGSALEVWIDYDSKGEWQRLKSIGGKRKNILNVPLIPARCDHFKLRFSGYGKCAIHDMTVYLTTGSNERR
jgi:hypothetical protein